VHDFYRRFLRPNATEAHYVRAGRAATVGLFLASAGVVYLIDTAKDTFDIILQIGAGTGLLYLVRWFWWRVNAWCEIVAMTSSLAVSIVFLILKKNGLVFSTDAALMITVAVTTVCWLIPAYAAPATDRRVLEAFYAKVRPFGPGWADVRRGLGLGARDAADAGQIPLAMIGWFSGCVTIWSSLFVIGSALYGRWIETAVLAVVFLASGLTLLAVVRRLWSAPVSATTG
jgi:hypothetical protein